MKYWLVVGGLVGSLGTARAQGSPPPRAASTEPVAAFLEHRVPDELAAQGILLSRRGLVLHVAPNGDGVVLALVDASTQHVEASTKLDALPVDREAAVASATRAAAGLAAQIAPPQLAAPVEDQREAAELQYRRDAIRFDHDFHILVAQNYGSVHREWFAVHGELDQRIDPEEFYKLVERPDLVEEYQHRHRMEVGGMVVGTIGVASGLLAYVALRESPDDACSAGACDAAAAARIDEQNSTARLVSFSLLGVAAIGFGVGTYYALNAQPISEYEAKQLAEQHNQALRRTLGLPVVDVRVAPVASASSGGLALSARF